MVEDTSKGLNPIEARKALGRSHVQSGKLEEAIKVFSNVLTDFPDDLDSYITLGDLYHQIGDDKLALLMYNQALRLNPASSTLRERIDELSVPERLSPANAQEGAAGEFDPVEGMLKQLAHRDGPISEEEINRAAELLKTILTSPQPAQVVAAHLEEVDSLLPALIELNIRQARADGRPDLASGLQELLLHVNLKIEQRDIPAPIPVGTSPFYLPTQRAPRSSPYILILNPETQELCPRMALAAESLMDLGCNVQFAGEGPLSLVDKPDVVLVNNPHTSLELMRSMAIYAAAGVPIIHDLDQDFEEMPANHPDYERFGLGNLSHARAYMSGLMLANCVTIPSPTMAEALGMARCPVRLVPDGWSSSNTLWKKPAARRSSINVGWVGLPGQVDDVSPIRRVVIRIMREFRQAQLVIAGEVNVYLLFDTLPESRKLFLPAMTMEDHPYLLSQMDLLMVPLRNIPFNRGQSDRILVEAGVRQIPWIASPVPMVTEWGVGGLSADAEEEWYEALRQMVSSEELRHTLGMNGHQKALLREKQYVGSAWLSVVQECLGSELVAPAQAFMDA